MQILTHRKQVCVRLIDNLGTKDDFKVDTFSCTQIPYFYYFKVLVP